MKTDVKHTKLQPIGVPSHRKNKPSLTKRKDKRIEPQTTEKHNIKHKDTQILSISACSCKYQQLCYDVLNIPHLPHLHLTPSIMCWTISKASLHSLHLESCLVFWLWLVLMPFCAGIISSPCCLSVQHFSVTGSRVLNISYSYVSVVHAVQGPVLSR